MGTNFLPLQNYDEQLFRLGVLAEQYFQDDPNTALIKLRQLGERLAQQVASRFGSFTSIEESQLALIRRLEFEGLIEREVAGLFHDLRINGNAATHGLQGDHASALSTLKIAWQLGGWFHRTFGDPQFRSGPFQPPQPAEKATLTAQLQDLQSHAAPPSAVVASGLRKAARTAAAAIDLDEAATRQLIDEQLRQAGWEADSQALRYGAGARPQKNRNVAIAEWPTRSGPADYVLFVGLTPMAAVEAKRANKDVAGVLPQAQRYCRDFEPSDEVVAAIQHWGQESEYRIPFAFSSNGRPYLRQHRTKSGIWFRDLRRNDHLAVPLDGWYSPDGLKDLARQDVAAADAQLRREAFSYGFPLRPYQRRAIEATEAAIAGGQRELMLAMATGTGKTKTCIALIYRLLKTGRFRRVLFLVDRSELGTQAGDAFKETRMESLRSFADIYGIKELNQREAESDTKVHIATVQAMVQRLLLGSEEDKPTVDTYDLIVVDECQRGYLLDRELSDRELRFRDFNDYVSKYRRVLDMFDAVKIGLTATPALHTIKIFGQPVFVYRYREAVVDGFLVDHEPPILIATDLSREGIVWEAGEEVKLYNPQTDQIELFTTPDQLRFSVEAFNRQVITESFNSVVCKFLATELDPLSPGKTLIFCASNAHADLVVFLLKEAFREYYGEVADDAVAKITGAIDKPEELIRRYKNEAFPNVAVTVDLLSTGVDVPAISNIVFLRRMNSRILYDQMIGRATRLCEAIGKDSFRIFDAVGIYQALQNFTQMQPVVVNPKISFSQLLKEMENTTDEESELVREQLIAKLRRKQRHLSESAESRFRLLTGEEPAAFISRLQQLPIAEARRWLGTIQGLGELLDEQWQGPAEPQFLSEHDDHLRSIERGYGNASRPEDYLEGFTAFVRDPGNDLPALTTVLQRRWELTRQDLRALKLALDQRGNTEATLATAWRETTNQAMAASIMGYIRQAALGDPLMPYEQRVEKALQRILASRAWTTPQRQWLQRIANQTKAITIVDREALDDDALLFRREGGGWQRLNNLFGGELDQVLQRFQAAVWEAA
jgi:type I restriction enzyme R subunit